MAFFGTTLRLIGFVWLALAIAAIVIGHAWILYTQGFSALQDVLSPFNVFNLLAIVVTVLPGYGLLKLGERLEGRARARQPQQ